MRSPLIQPSRPSWKRVRSLRAHCATVSAPSPGAAGPDSPADPSSGSAAAACLRTAARGRAPRADRSTAAAARAPCRARRSARARDTSAAAPSRASAHRGPRRDDASRRSCRSGSARPAPFPRRAARRRKLRRRATRHARNAGARCTCAAARRFSCCSPNVSSAARASFSSLASSRATICRVCDETSAMSLVS